MASAGRVAVVGAGIAGLNGAPVSDREAAERVVSAGPLGQTLVGDTR